MVSKFSEQVHKEHDQLSLRKFLKLKLDCSQKEIQHLIEKGFVSINQRKETFGSKKLKAGQRVHIEDLAFDKLSPSKQATVHDDILVLWENETLLAVNKPAGIPSQKTKDQKRYSMEHWAKSYKGSTLYLTHRLDRDTSGVLLFAKTKEMESLCFDWFKHRKVQKTYHAIAYGKAKTGSLGTWIHHLGEANKRGGRACFKAVKSGGLRAETDFRLIKNYGVFSYWELKPHTGRTHQLRVQLATEGHPIVGDDLYDLKYRQRASTPHHFLHAHALQLPEQEGEGQLILAPYPKSWIKHWDFIS